MTDLLYTAEVRWFFRGELPKAFRAWFEVDLALHSETRTDAYLILPGCETVGVKQREGRFEVKALRGEPQRERFSPEVTGITDEWVKWSYGATGIDPFIKGLRDAPDGWIEVKKERWSRTFSLDGGTPKEVEAVLLATEGCSIEVTSVGVRDARWWTIGFEAFGTIGRLRDNLRVVSRHFFGRKRPPAPLLRGDSCSYPVWLNRLA